MTHFCACQIFYGTFSARQTKSVVTPEIIAPTLDVQPSSIHHKALYKKHVLQTNSKKLIEFGRLSFYLETIQFKTFCFSIKKNLSGNYCTLSRFTYRFWKSFSWVLKEDLFYFFLKNNLSENFYFHYTLTLYF